MKFGRRYKLTVQIKPLITALSLPGNVNADGTAAPATGSSSGQQQIVIEMPFTVQFNVNRNIQASQNTMTILIYNLNLEHRNAIFADRFYPFQVQDGKYVFREISFEAGYDSLATLFIGSIFNAYSYRQGSDIITAIEARDGGVDITTSQTSETLAAGIPVKDAVTKLSNSFPNIKQGVIGSIPGEFAQALTLDGNTFSLIKDCASYPQSNVFVDLQQINVLQQNEAIKGEVIVLDASSGLLNAPQRGDSFLTVTTLFEPRVVVGQLIKVDSSFFKQYNGTYKVGGVNHQGTISEAFSGECVSSFSLLLNNQLFGQTLELSK